MRTIAIIGTDWEGADPTWIRQPFTDGGRLHFDRRRVEDWANVFTELGGMARVDTIAIGCRGANDTGAVASLPLARAAYRNASPKPALMPWNDTVGLPDLTHAIGQGPFDFGNAEHIRIGWNSYARLFFDHFGDCPLERTPNGKVLIAWWGIESQTGHGFVNQWYAQRLLDTVDANLAAMGLGGADHLVDQSWAKLVPNLNAYAVHDWFNPWGSPAKSYSIRTHSGVTTGIVVPSFWDPNSRTEKIPPRDGNTLRAGLAACRAANAHYVLMESGTDFAEGAELMRDAFGDTSKLDAIREHVTLLKPIDPIEPDFPEIPEEDLSMPVATLCLRRSERIAHPTKPGYYTSPYPGKPDKVLAVAPPTGVIQERDMGTHGPWESWKEEGDRAVFDDVFGYTFAFPLVD